MTAMQLFKQHDSCALFTTNDLMLTRIVKQLQYVQLLKLSTVKNIDPEGLNVYQRSNLQKFRQKKRVIDSFTARDFSILLDDSLRLIKDGSIDNIQLGDDEIELLKASVFEEVSDIFDSQVVENMWAMMKCFQHIQLVKGGLVPGSLE